MANLLQHILNTKLMKISRSSPENSRPKACYFLNIELNIQPQKILGVPLNINSLKVNLLKYTLDMRIAIAKRLLRPLSVRPNELPFPRNLAQIKWQCAQLWCRESWVQIPAGSMKLFQKLKKFLNAVTFTSPRSSLDLGIKLPGREKSSLVV